MPNFKQDTTTLSEEIFQALKADPLLRDNILQDEVALQAIKKAVERAALPRDAVRTADVTILLSDIRGFSAISEAHSARDVVTLLNRYFDCMGDIITRHGGHIDKLMGDSILALFGVPQAGPDDVKRAISCAVQMQLAMNKLNADSKMQDMPPLYMGIALNTGNVVVGDLGSAHYNEYTVIGDEVNLTARIEAHCLRGQILLSENTYSLARDFIEVGEPNTVEVKGARNAIKLYELHATSSPQHLMVPRRDVRKSPRIKVSMPVIFQRLNGKIVLDDKYEGEVLDISYHGLLVQTDLQLAKSSEIKMSMALDLFSKRTTDVYMRIVHTDAIDGHYRSNMEFTSIDEEGQLTIKKYVDQLVVTV